jgi:hypothetical protein
MPFDSLVRTKQLNKPELSGYIVDVLLQYLKTGTVTGIALNTGQLTGQFYPLYQNPSGYINTGYLTGLATKLEVTGNNTALLSYVNTYYYPRNNPSGYVTSTGLQSGFLTRNQPNFFTFSDSGIQIFDVPGSTKIIDYSPGTKFVIQGFTSGNWSPVINLEPGLNGQAYISGFDLYARKINGQIALGSGDVNSLFVSWDYFNTGKDLSFNYFSLFDSNYLGYLVFDNDKFLIQGQHLGYPSENYFIDLYGTNGSLFGLSYSRPIIAGFDISGRDVYSNSYPVLTSKDLTGLATKSDLLITSGKLHDDDDRLRTELMTYITGVSGDIYYFTGAGNVVVFQSGVFVTVSGMPYSTGFMGDSSYVRTTGYQRITGQKIFYDNIGNRTIDEFIRTTFDGNDTRSIQWNSRQLYDAQNNSSIDWNSRYAYISGVSGSSRVIIDWGYQTLRDSTGRISVDWTKRILSGDWNVSGDFRVLGQRLLTGGAFLLTSGNQRYSGILNVVSGWVNISGVPVTTGGPYYPRSSNPSGYATYTGMVYMSDDFDPAFFRKYSGAVVPPIIGLQVQENGPRSPIPSYRYIFQVQGWVTGALGRRVYSPVTTSGYYDNPGNYDININWSPLSSYYNTYIITVWTQPFGGGSPIGPYQTGAWSETNDNKNGVNYGDLTWFSGATGRAPQGAIPNWVTWTGKYLKSISVSGNQLTGDIFFSGVGGFGISLSGNTVIFSGGGGTTGNYVTTDITGNAFYPRYGNPAGYITSASISGAGVASVAGLSGVINVNGAGNISISTGSPNTIFISGATGNLVFQGMTGQFIDSSKTGIFVYTGNTGVFVTIYQTGQFAPAGLTGQFITTAQTGHIHSQYALASATGQFIDSSKTGIFVYTGNTGVFITTYQTGQYAPAGLTGQFITTAQTGHIHSQYALSSATGQFVDSSKTGQFLDTSDTGWFVTTGNTGVFVTIYQTGHIHSQYALASATGQFVDSSKTGQFVDSSKTGQYITTAMTGIFVSTGITGNAFYPRYGNPAGYLTASQAGGVSSLVVTGISLSGVITITGAGIVSVLTGKAGTNQILIQAPSTGDFYPAFDPRYWNGTFIDSWSSLGFGSFSEASGIFDSSCPVGNTSLQTTGFLWFRGPLIPLDKSQNYEAELWMMRENTISPTQYFYMMVNEYDDNKNYLGGDGSEYYYPYADLQSTIPTGIWTKRRAVIGPQGGKDHHPTGHFISVGFIINYLTGAERWRWAGFKCRPIMSGMVTANQTGQFVTTAQTGQFAPAGLTGQFITTAQTGHIHSQYALVSSTGQFVDSSKTGQFVDSSKTGQFIDSSKTGIFVYTGNTGVFVTIYQTGQYAPAGLTGQFITTAQTGSFVSIYQTGVLIATGDPRNLALLGNNQFSQFAQYLVGNSSVQTYYYPNIATYVSDNPSVSGAIVFNTPVFRTEASRFMLFHIQGYDEVLSQIENSYIAGYLYPSNPGNVNGLLGTLNQNVIIDLGNTETQKAIGINKSGYVAIAITSSGDIRSYVRYTADAWITYGSPSPVYRPTGWSWSVETGAFCGFGDYRALTSGATYISAAKTGVLVARGETGHIHSQYALASATGQFVDSSKTGQFVDSSKTGQFVDSSKTGIFVYSGNTGVFVTTYQTGIFVYTGKTGVFVTTYQTGQFVDSSKTGQFVDSSKTGQFVWTGITGSAFYPRYGNPDGYLTSSQGGGVSSINITGTSLSGIITITGAGGIFVKTGAPGTNQILISGDTSTYVTSAATGALTGMFLPCTIASRALGTAANSYAEIGYLNCTNGTHSAIVGISINDAGWSQSKMFIVNTLYNQYTSWYKVVPYSDSGPYATNDLDLDVFSSGTTTLFFRVRRTGGSTAANPITTIAGFGGLYGGIFESFVPTLGAGTVAAPGNIINAFFVPTNSTGQLVDSSKTGQFVDSSKTGQFVDSSKTGQYITTAQTGNFVPIGITGNAFYPRYGNPAGYLTASQGGGVSSINVTGTSLSGVVVITGAGNISVVTGVAGTNQVVVSGITGNLVFQGMTGQFLTTNMPKYDLIQARSTLMYANTLYVASLSTSGGAGKCTDISGYNSVDWGAKRQLIKTGWAGSVVEIVSLDWQNNQLSGAWSVEGLTISGISTGQAFYPRYGNPAGYLTSAPGGSQTPTGVTGLIVSGGIALSGGITITGVNSVIVSGTSPSMMYINSTRPTVFMPTGVCRGVNSYGLKMASAIMSWKSGDNFVYVFKASGLFGGSPGVPQILFGHIDTIEGHRVRCTLINSGIVWATTQGHPQFSGDPTLTIPNLVWKGGADPLAGNSTAGIYNGTTSESHVDVFEFYRCGGVVYANQLVQDAYISNTLLT